jgi:drug/metabolite transporter (DMT)-like permease
MKYNKPGAVAPLNYLGIPTTYFLDWLVIGNEFGWMELVGATIIFLTNITLGIVKVKYYLK